MRQILLSHGEDGYWITECPSLPGCISQGKTREQAIANAKEAVEVYIAALEADGLPVPEEHFDAMLVAI
jgi:predicted RNase H-like HicB family nuclease